MSALQREKIYIYESIPWLYKLRTFDCIYPFVAKQYYSILVTKVLLNWPWIFIAPILLTPAKSNKHPGYMLTNTCTNACVHKRNETIRR